MGDFEKENMKMRPMIIEKMTKEDRRKVHLRISKSQLGVKTVEIIKRPRISFGCETPQSSTISGVNEVIKTVKIVTFKIKPSTEDQETPVQGLIENGKSSPVRLASHVQQTERLIRLNNSRPSVSSDSLVKHNIGMALTKSPVKIMDFENHWNTTGGLKGSGIVFAKESQVKTTSNHDFHLASKPVQSIKPPPTTFYQSLTHNNCSNPTNMLVTNAVGLSRMSSKRDSRIAVRTKLTMSGNILIAKGPESFPVREEACLPGNEETALVEIKENSPCEEPKPNHTPLPFEFVDVGSGGALFGLDDPEEFSSQIFKQDQETEEKPHICQDCILDFPSKTSLENHIRACHEERSSLGDFRGISFGESRLLANDQLALTRDKLFESDQCHKVYNSRGMLHRHKLTHAERCYTCEECGKSYTDKFNLSRHVKIHSHIKSHRWKTKFQCEECQKLFTRRWNLNIHLRLHTGYRPFPCSYCDRKFISQNHRSKHEVTHTLGKPFTCNECGNSFALRSNLIVHQRVHSSEKPYKCNKCNKAYTTNTGLVYHLRTHSGEKPFECDQCSKSFTRKGNLEIHRRLHSGEKPFACDFCERCFVSRSHLTKHKLIHVAI